MSASLSFSPSDLRLGPCKVIFDGNDLGGTMEGVTVSLAPATQDLLIDQFGSEAVDSVITGMAVSVKFTLAAAAKKELWKVAMPYADLISTGTKAIHLKNPIGTKLSQFAKALTLHPMDKDDADYSEDHNFFKAYCKSAIEMKFDASSQQGLAIEMVAIVDDNGDKYHFGDLALGKTAAAAAAPVAGSNTGDGTCTAQSASALTVTETVTITCIGLNGTNKSAWKVEGSVTGAIGTVELTGGAGNSAAFTSDYVNFTLTDGSTDFIVGDEFTIATTAANYA